MFRFTLFRLVTRPSLTASFRLRGLFGFTLLAVGLPATALAGRPLTTDDAAIVDHGACQLESWFERSRSDSDPVSVGWLNPACNPWGATEFSFGAGREHNSENHATVTAWQIKRLIRSYDHRQAGFAVSLGDQRDRRIHRHALGDTSLTTIATFPLSGTTLLSHVNLGVIRQREEGGWRIRGNWGTALDWGLTANTRVSLETFGLSGERANWQLGLLYELIPGQVQIDMSVSSPYGRWSSDRTLTFGAVFLSPPFLH